MWAWNSVHNVSMKFCCNRCWYAKCDAKSWMMEGVEKHKHGGMLPSTTRMSLKSLQQSKYRYHENLFMSIDEIDTLCSPTTVTSSLLGAPKFYFIFNNMACDKQNAVRKYFSMDHHANVDCFYLYQTYTRIPNIWYAITWTCWSLVQTLLTWNAFTTITWILIYRTTNFVVSWLLTKKIWISSDKQE